VPEADISDYSITVTGNAGGLLLFGDGE